MTAATCQFRNDAARLVMRGLAQANARVIKQARSAHGSDCDCDKGHKFGPMGQCRCVRVMRVRLYPAEVDWLLVFGDRAESQAFKLFGPYTPDTPLSYGGGFWEEVKV